MIKRWKRQYKYNLHPKQSVSWLHLWLNPRVPVPLFGSARHLSDGWLLGFALTDGDSDGMEDGLPDIEGFSDGWLLGFALTDGDSDGMEDGDRLGLSDPNDGDRLGFSDGFEEGPNEGDILSEGIEDTEGPSDGCGVGSTTTNIPVILPTTRSVNTNESWSKMASSLNPCNFKSDTRMYARNKLSFDPKVWRRRLAALFLHPHQW